MLAGDDNLINITDFLKLLRNNGILDDDPRIAVAIKDINKLSEEKKT